MKIIKYIMENTTYEIFFIIEIIVYNKLNFWEGLK
ncbi:hypothetical protein JOC61_001455 [Marinitoga litoralis]|jgi:hypothetical protein|nr:hypothetical protein [Marinitoga litoralis]